MINVGLDRAHGISEAMSRCIKTILTRGFQVYDFASTVLYSGLYFRFDSFEKNHY